VFVIEGISRIINVPPIMHFTTQKTAPLAHNRKSAITDRRATTATNITKQYSPKLNTGVFIAVQSAI
jgi:hypothetical protein